MSGFGLVDTPRDLSGRALAVIVILAAIALAALAGVLGVPPFAKLLTVLDVAYFRSALRLTVPIAFAALGGIFAEKSGVINIGLEGLLIISAFVGIAVTWLLSGGGAVAQWMVWIGFFVAVLASVLVSLVFAVICIKFRADQIIAGLAVWLVALGFAPFAAIVLWGSVNSPPSVGTLNRFAITVPSFVPGVGTTLVNANPPIYMLVLAVPLCWFLLYRTSFGHHVRASGENPKALDTVGINVSLVRYKAVLLSGFLSGIGGASLALGQVGSFTGGGTTMVSGRGWIALTAYLFGNYNPFGAFGASFLFAALSALEIRLQQLGFNVPPQLIQMIPYVTVIVVLAFVGRTRTPESAGEHYESGDD